MPDRIEKEIIAVIIGLNGKIELDKRVDKLEVERKKRK